MVARVRGARSRRSFPVGSVWHWGETRVAALPEHLSNHVPRAAARVSARAWGSPGDAAGGL